MKETFSLPVIRYKDSEGNPTCKTDEGSCPFLEGFVFNQYSCIWDKPRFTASVILVRTDGIGSLIPIDACPLWNGEKR
jgi:hypothetical protein